MAFTAGCRTNGWRGSPWHMFLITVLVSLAGRAAADSAAAQSDLKDNDGDTAGIVRLGFIQTTPEEIFAEEETEGFSDEAGDTTDVESIELPPATEFDSASELAPAVELPPDSAYPAEVPITMPPSDGECAEEAIDLTAPEPKKEKSKRLKYRNLIREPYRAYRPFETGISWLPAGGEDFGWLDWQTEPYLERGEGGGFVSTFNIHWLSGPESVPLPPRLYDLVMGYQWRGSFSDRFSYDMYASVGIFSDFEGSARDGVRFPSHAVGMFHLNPSTDLVFGVDYLARDNITVLPVFGISLRDVGIYGLRLDLVFPRPRIDYMLSNSHRLYVAGNTTGGNWDIDFPSGADHVISYRDYRLTLGCESTDDDGELTAWEFGYVFGRSLELRGRSGDTRFDDAFVIRWVTRR